MPWPRQHKQQTRARIVEAAAAEFRANGVSGVGVAEIMRRAGLTHGGFYAHFASKEELLAEALERASRQARANLAGAADALPARRRLQLMIDRYLSPEHAAHPERGCPVAALAPELARADRKTRRQLSRIIRRRLDSLRPRRGDSRHVSGEEAIGALACMVGGLILARGLGGTGGGALLKSCRAFLHRALGRRRARVAD
jgi:TetR/AcrR family transcriptional repressor of nem operon